MLEWLPDAEKITSDDMMNKQTNIQFLMIFFVCYII